MPTIDELSPAYIGDDKITLTLDPSSVLLALSPIQVNVDYSPALPEGISLPVELVVIGGDSTYINRIFRQSPPTSIVFVSESPGPHLVLIRELAHNRYVGRLAVTLAGDPLQATASLV